MLGPLPIDPSTVFLNFWHGQVRGNRRYHWEERLKISNIAKFKGLLKMNEDVSPQSREILQIFVCWLALPPYNRL